MATESTPISDRRRHERYELLAQVRVKQAREDLVLELCNISRSGALLILGSLNRPPWIDVDRVVDLAIVHPVSLDPVPLQGRVVRVQRDERGLSFAIEFVDLSEATKAQVRELTRLGTAQPPSLPPRPPPLPPTPPPLPK